MPELGTFDAVIILVVCLSTLFAFMKGFIRSLFSLFTWLGSAAISAYLCKYVYAYLKTGMNPAAAMLVASVGSFFLALLLLHLLCTQLTHLFAKGAIGGFIDKTLGFAFGLARGMLVVCCVFLGFQMVYAMLKVSYDGKNPGPEWFVKAKTYNTLKISTGYFLALVPDGFYKRVEETFAELKGNMPSIAENPSNVALFPSALDGNQKAMVQDILAALPDKAIENLSVRYPGNKEEISTLEKMAMLRDAVVLYREAKENNSLKEEHKVLSDNQLDTLYKSLTQVQGNSVSSSSQTMESVLHLKKEGEGYNAPQIKEMQRLIDTVQ